VSSLTLKEPPATSTSVVSQIIISQVAIQGTGTSGTLSSAATINQPTTPGPWISLGDWPCHDATNGDIHMAAAYRVADASDLPGALVTWSFYKDAGKTIPESFFASVVNVVFQRNVSNSSPIDVVGNPVCAPAPANLSFNIPAITTLTLNDLIVALYGASGGPGRNQGLAFSPGNPFFPLLTLEPNAANGPVLQPAYNYSTNISPEFGALGSYGPLVITTQPGPSEAVGVLVGLKPLP
jgi:hypothetical protein